jgi:hypothetical protein
VTLIRGIAPTVAASVVTPPNGVPIADCCTRRGSLARIVFADTTSGAREAARVKSSIRADLADEIGAPIDSYGARLSFHISRRYGLRC